MRQENLSILADDANAQNAAQKGKIDKFATDRIIQDNKARDRIKASQKQLGELKLEGKEIDATTEKALNSGIPLDIGSELINTLEKAQNGDALAMADLVKGSIQQRQEVGGVIFRFSLRLNSKTFQPILKFSHVDDFADSDGSSVIDERDIGATYGRLTPDGLRDLLIEKVNGYLQGERPGKLQTKEKRMDAEHREGVSREQQIHAHKSAIMTGREPEPSPVLEIQARSRDKILREQSKEVIDFVDKSKHMDIA